MALLSEGITQLLVRWSEGDDEALNKLTPLVYGELRRLAGHYMRGEKPGHVLQATALVHEAYLKLEGFREVPWKNRSHFMGVVIREMRRILVDYARRQGAGKRGGGERPENVDEVDVLDRTLSPFDLVAIDAALDKLEATDERQSRVFDARYFGGLSNEETAALLGISDDAVSRAYTAAKAFISRELGY